MQSLSVITECSPSDLQTIIDIDILCCCLWLLSYGNYNGHPDIYPTFFGIKILHHGYRSFSRDKLPPHVTSMTAYLNDRLPLWPPRLTALLVESSLQLLSKGSRVRFERYGHKLSPFYTGLTIQRNDVTSMTPYYKSSIITNPNKNPSVSKKTLEIHLLQDLVIQSLT